jgi:hypothetical protein
MKKNEDLKTTTNSRVYNKLHGANVSGCGWCMPHRGCNRMHRKLQRSWKQHRDNQWKNDS